MNKLVYALLDEELQYWKASLLGNCGGFIGK